MPWQDKGDAQILPANALAANVLCERHNNALGPIDTLGLRAFDALIEASDYAVNGRHSARVQHHLISGDGLELWMFKLLVGIHFGGIAAAEGGLLRDTCGFPLDEVVLALTNGKLPPASSFWIFSNLGLVQRGQIAIGPLIEVANNRNIGVQAQFGPIRFESTVVSPPISLAHQAAIASQKRPRVIDFVGPARDARVILSWPDWATEVKRLEVKVVPEADAAV